jgi:hypothetical protein
MLLFEAAISVSILLRLADSVSLNPLLGLARVMTVVGLTACGVALFRKKTWGWLGAGVWAAVGLAVGIGPIHRLFHASEVIPDLSVFELALGALVVALSAMGTVSCLRHA